MSRVRLTTATAALRIVAGIGIAGVALAGCSSSSSSDWFKPSPPPPQALQFTSQPPGANVQTAQGQNCVTPCTLPVPVTNQSVTFSMNGYMPQTVQVSVHEPEHSMFSSPPPDLVPNPVQAMLQPAPPPPRKARPRPHVAAVKSATPMKPAVSRQPSIAAPEPASMPQDNVFPPPPPMTSPSPFPPAPQGR